MREELSRFGEAIAKLGLTRADAAVALLWFYKSVNGSHERTPTELGNTLAELGLSGRPNTTRLREALRKHPQAVRGKGKDTFRIGPKGAALDEAYSKLLGGPRRATTHLVLPLDMTAGTRKYLEQLAEQINGAYESGYYDAAAVLCRRVAESLLVEAFDVAGHLDKIQKGGVTLMFSDVIRIAGSGQYIKLGRKSKKALADVKDIGDRAAHDRYYVTTSQDVGDAFRRSFRALIAELLAKARISAP